MFFKHFWLAEISTSSFLKPTSLIKKWKKKNNKKKTRKTVSSNFQIKVSQHVSPRKFFLPNYSIASQEPRNKQRIPIQRGDLSVMQGKEGRRKIGLVPENIEDKDRKGTIEDSGKNEAIHVLVFPEGKETKKRLSSWNAFEPCQVRR